MKLDVLLGLQWGDEGKGKIVDLLSKEYDVIARFQGGPNAGHSLEFNNIKQVLHTIPSGIFHPNTKNIVGNGMVFDPVIFKNEVQELENKLPEIKEKLLISQKAHLILPSHRILDSAAEAAKGKTKIGSTLKGIGPTYMDKTGRNGLRIGDIFSENFKNKYKTLKEKHKQILALYNYDYDIEQYEKEWFAGIEKMKEFDIIQGEYYINEALQNNKKVLAEGAQGTLLDIDYGSYPFVTSSNTIAPGASSGLGVAPNNTGEVFGIFKAYCTRVGSGPFPTELTGEKGEKLQKEGNEYGATTGRARRCGWLDLVALKYAIMLNGVTKLIMTKADVFDAMDKINVATKYTYKGRNITELPFDINTDLEPVYETFEGWETPTSNLKNYADLPENFKTYIRFIENELQVPVYIISLGPDRNQTIIKE